MFIIVTSNSSAGDVRALGRGDVVEVNRLAIRADDWARLWDAVGVAVQRGAELRIKG
jgi:hypothetical protein